MSRIEKLITEAIGRGDITHAEHERIMSLVHRDGKIDAAERELLSKLFEAMQSGRLTLTGAPQAAPDAARRIAEAKRAAVELDCSKEIQAEEKRAGQTGGQAPAAQTPFAVGSEAAPKHACPPLVPKPSCTPDEIEPIRQLAADPFLSRAKGRRSDGGAFALETERLLDIRLNGKVWIKTGAMVAYYGAIKFTREGITEHGITKLLKKAVTGEGTALTKAAGQGNLYLADRGKKISLIELRGHSLVVNGRNILAFEETIHWDITYLRQFAAVWAGGFFNVRLSGRGYAAITTHFDPLILKVSPLDPVMTDVNATVAWSGSLSPQFKTDVSASTLIGRTSGETIQMLFEGDGFVVIQPYEERGETEPASAPEK